MLASDLGFLALGGILGLFAGAALIAVLRARPAAPRQIRLTVTPGSVPIRPSRTTLAGDPFAPEPRWVALGGPADLGRLGHEAAFATAVGQGGWNGTPVRSEAPHDSFPTALEAPIVTDAVTHPDLAHDPEAATDAEAVGLAVGSGPDPVFAAIAASPGGVEAGEGVGVPVLVERPGNPMPLLLTEADSGIAILEAAMRARRAATTAATGAAGAAPAGADAGAGDAGATDVAGSIMVMARPEPTGASNGHRPTARAARGSGRGSDGHRQGDAPPGDAGQAAPAGPDPCAEPRHTVDERCALAERMRLTAERAADTLREAQRTFDVHVAHAAAAEAVAEPRAQRAAKDEAQNTFRTERGRAGSREAVEQAARDWLQEINRINAAAREAGATLGREREAAAALQSTIERLTVEADAASVQAEGAEASCVLARESLATCEQEVREAELAASRGSGADQPEGADEPIGDTPVAVPAPTRAAGRGAASAPEPAPPEEEGALVAAIRAGGHPALLGLLTGDRAVMQRLVWELAGENPVDQRRWQVQLADLVDAIISRAIEACAFLFPDDHPFWAPFNRRQGRDIALALSSLGFRFDGLGGFSDDRVPTQRDVSLALGYAGLDPMRVRRWPTEGELGELYREVTVAADEYIIDAAPGLTLGELVGILGRRADALTEVWNAWGQIRPILLEEPGR